MSKIFRSFLGLFFIIFFCSVNGLVFAPATAALVGDNLNTAQVAALGWERNTAGNLVWGAGQPGAGNPITQSIFDTNTRAAGYNVAGGMGGVASSTTTSSVGGYSYSGSSSGGTGGGYSYSSTSSGAAPSVASNVSAPVVQQVAANAGRVTAPALPSSFTPEQLNRLQQAGIAQNKAGGFQYAAGHTINGLKVGGQGVSNANVLSAAGIAPAGGAAAGAGAATGGYFSTPSGGNVNYTSGGGGAGGSVGGGTVSTTANSPGFTSSNTGAPLAGAAGGAAGGAGGLKGIAQGTKANWQGMSRGAKWATGLAALGGALMVADSVKGAGPHTWGSVLEGAAGGAMVGGAVASVVPIGITTAVGAAIGAVGGGLMGGSQLFSETDCEHDPRVGVYTCCHTQFNKGERYVDIGGFMFCDEVPKIKFCMQGQYTEKVGNRIQQALRDDHWGPCIEDPKMWCPGFTKPDAEGGVLYDGALKPKQGKNGQRDADVCVFWKCDEGKGYVKSDNKCIPVSEVVEDPNNPNNPINPVVPNPLSDEDFLSYGLLISKLKTEQSLIVAQCQQ